MPELTYPRTAATIITRARMALGAYRAVPVREAAHDLDRALHDMWGYRFFALHNTGNSATWARLSQEILNAQQLLKPFTADDPDRLVQAAFTAMQTINCFEQATVLDPTAVAEPLYTRTQVQQAADAVFSRLSHHINSGCHNGRSVVTGALLALLDNPDSGYQDGPPF